MHSRIVICTMTMGRLYLQILSENFGGKFHGLFQQTGLKSGLFFYMRTRENPRTMHIKRP